MNRNLNGLNEQQMQAVVSNEQRLLVLAGAGSGKTKTLLQKIIYLIEEKRVKPSEILAITFTKNATNEMIDRLIFYADQSGEYEQLINSKSITTADINHLRTLWKKKFNWINGLTVRTFHSFCYMVLRDSGVNEFDNRFRIIGEEKRDDSLEWSKFVAPETDFQVMHKLLIDQCSDQDYLLKLKRYLIDYLIDKIHIKNNDPYNLFKDGKYFTSLDGTKVRSKSEQFIADWLYRHSIKFEYEPALIVKDFLFHPDFYIPSANLYIEHISDKSYSIARKEEQFEKGKLLLVKTFDSMTRDSALFNHTLDSIFKNRLPANYESKLNLSFREEFSGYQEEIKDFVRQIIRITDMIKVEGQDINELISKAEQDQHERIRDFYALAIPVVKQYLTYCINKSYLDFNDLISRTASLLRNHSDITHKYQSRYNYILVDEFQDVNNLQVDLINLLLRPQTQLFCVGDDWQSIYGFRGSNVSYIVEFEKYFPDSRTINLDLNYRSTQHIVGASNELIKKNKYKVDKEIRSLKQSDNKIVVFSGNSLEESVEYCLSQVKNLLKEGLTGDDILFLYRRTKMYTPYFERFRREGIRIQAKTIHASKGLEAKVVFAIGMTEGKGGFPDIWLEDRIFQMVKEANHDLLMEEERRLFYVAITRAKDKLFLISEKGNESSFIDEIPEIFLHRTDQLFREPNDPELLCLACARKLEATWLLCPYCGEKISRPC